MQVIRYTWEAMFQGFQPKQSVRLSPYRGYGKTDGRVAVCAKLESGKLDSAPARVGSESSLRKIGELNKALQLADTGGVAHFTQSLGFDLANALTGNLELTTDLFKGAGVTVLETEALL